MRPQLLVKAALAACIVGAVGMLTGATGVAQQGGGKGGGGGHTETAGNNLSYPVLLIAGTATAPAPFAATVDTLGTTYSWGCDVPEGTYPNTSCYRMVDNKPVYVEPGECQSIGLCAGSPTFSRIYWQKVSTNDWWAQATASETGVEANYLDWGDNLESRNWTTTSTIRVETTPFQDEVDVKKTGYEMWHVYGQGPDEVWGVRATNGKVAYYYLSPFSIIHTGNARLNMAKLSQGEATCPETAPAASPYENTVVNWFYDDVNKGRWENACTLRDTSYTAELNVGGKYVYGYNWTIRRDVLPERCPAFNRTNLAGWWRLTFYTPGDEVLFLNGNIPTAPPLLPPPEVLSSLSVTPLSETGEAVMLYNPVIDTEHSLTYIDICIKSSGGGGGKK